MAHCRTGSAAHPLRPEPRGDAESKSRGVRCSEPATGLRMHVDAQLNADDETRLAAMWDPPLDGEPVGGQPSDDAIAALFTSSGDHKARTAPRAGKRERRLRGAGRRRHDRSLSDGLDRPRATYRWVAVGAALVTVLVVSTLARNPSTVLSETQTVESTRAPSGHPAAPAPSGSRELDAPRRRYPRAARARRNQQHRRATARRALQRQRAARRARAAAARAPRRARVPSQPAAPSPTPTPTAQAPEPRGTPSPSAPSSACEEFPPC